jgi:hypothetical protein
MYSNYSRLQFIFAALITVFASPDEIRFCDNHSFLISARNSSLFLHIAEYGEWGPVARSLLKRYATSPSQLSSMADLRIGFLGSYEGRNTVLDIAKNILTPEQILHTCFAHNHSVITEYEYPTLRNLAEFCSRRDSDRVLYLHSKGSKASADHHYNPEVQHYNENVWRLIGEHFVIDQFNECVDSNADICGPVWTGNHFAGNFWSAKCVYVRELSGLPDPRTVVDRFGAETWIGQHGAGVRVLNCYNMKYHFYDYDKKIPIDFENETCADYSDKSLV